MPSVYPISPQISKTAFITEAKYREWYKRSLEDPEGFWAEQAKKFITWIEPWEKVLSGGFDLLDVNWFQGGKLNAAYNCLDRHLEKRAHEPAILWEGDNPNQTQTLTYRDVYERVCRFANVLKSFGIKKGARVCIYLPMIPEAAIAKSYCDTKNLGYDSRAQAFLCALQQSLFVHLDNPSMLDLRFVSAE